MTSGVYLRTEEHKKKLSQAQLGHKGYWTGKKRGEHSKEWKDKIGKSNKGKTRTAEQKIVLSQAQKGSKHSLQARKDKSFRQKGSVSHFWKGGLTKENKLIRSSLEYKLWREAVFKRDNYTCVFCGIRSGNGKKIVLNADHIKPFAYFPALRFAIDNGRTLCVGCHKSTDTYLGKCNDYMIKWKGTYRI